MPRRPPSHAASFAAVATSLRPQSRRTPRDLCQVPGAIISVRGQRRPPPTRSVLPLRPLITGKARRGRHHASRPRQPGSTYGARAPWSGLAATSGTTEVLGTVLLFRLLDVNQGPARPFLSGSLLPHESQRVLIDFDRQFPLSVIVRDSHDLQVGASRPIQQDIRRYSLLLGQLRIWNTRLPQWLRVAGRRTHQWSRHSSLFAADLYTPFDPR